MTAKEDLVGYKALVENVGIEPLLMFPKHPCCPLHYVLVLTSMSRHLLLRAEVVHVLSFIINLEVCCSCLIGVHMSVRKEN